MGTQRPRFLLLAIAALGITVAYAQPAKAPATAETPRSASKAKAKSPTAQPARETKTSPKKSADAKTKTTPGAAKRDKAAKTPPPKVPAKVDGTKVAAVEVLEVKEGTTTTRSGPVPVRQRAASVGGKSFRPRVIAQSAREHVDQGFTESNHRCHRSFLVIIGINVE